MRNLTININRDMRVNMLNALFQLITVNVIDRRIIAVIDRLLIGGSVGSLSIWRVRLIDKISHNAGNDHDSKRTREPGDPFVTAGAALGLVARLALGLAALILGGVPR